MMYRKTAMVIAASTSLAAAVFGIAAMAAGPIDFSKLSVMRDVRPGLWEHRFTTTPKNPAARDINEKGCVSQAQLDAMIRESLASGGQEQFCPATVDSDAMTMARFTMHCPATVIPELGVDTPGGDMLGTITKTLSEEHWVVSVKTMAVPGVTPAAVWRHDYRRLGACPG